MNDVDSHIDVSRDYERFENRLLSQDRDVAHSKTADIDDAQAWMLVEELIEQNVVTPVPELQILVHEPTDNAFRSEKALALFHKGWSAKSGVVENKQVSEQ